MFTVPKVVIQRDGCIAFSCPGCKEQHRIDPTKWKWDGSLITPTISPSILVRSGHFAHQSNGGSMKDKDTCWCTYNEEQRRKGEPESGFSCSICHSFVKDGKIQFLDDSLHELAGQTVELPDVTTYA